MESLILSFVENAETILLHFTLELEGLRDQVHLNDEQTYVVSYMVSNGKCCMVYWVNFYQAHLGEVGLTQNWETMALQNLTTQDLL